jgi:hypothetical protein
MKNPKTVTEPRFVDEQNDLIDPLPVFVTRTTLRSILHTNGAKTLLDLDAHSAASKTNKPTDSVTTETE